MTRRYYMRGDTLSPATRKQTLARYVHRYTKEHIPDWARKPCAATGKPYPVQFESDADWLRRTLFPVTKRGDLVAHTDSRGSCTSYPSWPDHPHLSRKGAGVGVHYTDDQIPAYRVEER